MLPPVDDQAERTRTPLGDALATAGDAAVRFERAAEAVIERNLQRHPAWRRAVGWIGWLLVVAYFAFAVTFLVLRYWLLPDIGSYSPQIEQMVSKAVGERVAIGTVRAGWQGLRPEINLSDVRIFDREGNVALSLPAIEAVIGWSSVFHGGIRFESLTLDRPNLEVRRDAQGRFYVAGLEIRRGESGPGLSDWLIAQRAILISDGRVTWDDVQRKARRLDLRGVNLLVRNTGDAHRFSLRAFTERDLASALDIRGDFRGKRATSLSDWSGKLYAELEYADLAAWREWIDYPLEVRSGQGGLRVWLDVASGRVAGATADVALANVNARLAPDLPPMELDYLRGRLGGKRHIAELPVRSLDSLPGDVRTPVRRAESELFARGVSLRTRGGVALPAADFSLRHSGPADGGTASEASGEFAAHALELQPLAQLAEFLPLPAPARKRLSDTEPRGRVLDLKLSWRGLIDMPTQYTAHSRFEALGMRASSGIPGFANLTGVIDATEKGGSLALHSKKARLEFVGLVAEPRPEFDALDGQLAWRVAPGRWSLNIGQLSFSNGDVAGSLSGTFERAAGKRGVIDLTGSFPRLDARRGWRYIPFLPDSIHEYLSFALLGGRASDARLRLKGDLDNFPFATARDGLFQVSGRFSGAEFRYAEGWPQIVDGAGDIAFDGLRMQVLAQRATISGVRATNVRATIPDLFRRNEVLTIEGQAEGASGEFLRFIETSPVTRLIDGATQDVQATGNGRGQLRLDIPLRNLNATRVAGNYQFQNNQVTYGDLPQFTQVNGRLEFTDAGISLRGVSAQWMGGPVAINGQPRNDGALVIGAQGTASVAAVRRAFDVPFAAQMSGAAPWRGEVVARRRSVDVVVETNLQGISIDLPAPFGKSAADTLPLRVERGTSSDSDLGRRTPNLRIPSRGDAISIAIGGAGNASARVNAMLLRRAEGRGYALDRGTVALNEPAVLVDRAGMYLTGAVPVFDAERWLSVLTSGTTPSAQPAAQPTAQAGVINSINLRIGSFDVSGKRFHDLLVRASARTNIWSGTVEAKEFAGEVQWRPEGRGRVQARLRHLTLPEDRTDTQAATPGAPAIAGSVASPAREYPALDVVAEEFSLRERKLGRLELIATNADAREWRIEKLQLATPDSTLIADGIWQSWAARPSVNFNVKLDIGDVGRYLDRMGFPKVMQSGAAQLGGRIGWAGAPQTIDYATLTGNLTLSAQKGQFLKADPGIAKLLGVLSLQSLVTFDLRDMFREGFSYDTITGAATVARGVMHTQDFRMKGPSAAVDMTGTIDLAKETQNLHMRVVPSVGDGASTITALLLANPAVGVLATLFQRLLKDPLGQVFSIEYDVTGSWNDPKVARTRIESPQPSPSSVQ